MMQLATAQHGHVKVCEKFENACKCPIGYAIQCETMSWCFKDPTLSPQAQLVPNSRYNTVIN